MTVRLRNPIWSIIVLSIMFGGLTAQAEDKESKPSVTFSAEQLKLPGKKGIGFTLRDPNSEKAKKVGGTWDSNMPKVKALNVSWNYSWGSGLAPNQPEGIEFVPMIWGAWSKPEELESGLKKNLEPLFKSGKMKRLLGFNEPDKKDQSNMAYMKAIGYWPALMSLNVPLCSPACANPEGINDASTQGVPGTWMRDFMTEVDKRGYRVDYVGAHWYGGTSAKSFETKMRRIYEKYGKRPLLITEFAPADWKAKSPEKNRHNPAKVLAFMKDVLPWMEEQDWIAGYAWFPFGIDSRVGTCSALFDKDGNLTACGRYYKSVTPDNPKGDQTIKPDAPHHKK